MLEQLGILEHDSKERKIGGKGMADLLEVERLKRKFINGGSSTPMVVK